MGCSIGGTAEIFGGTFVTTSTSGNTTNASAMVMRNDGLPDAVICHGVILDSLNPTSSAPVVFSRNGLNTFIFSANAGFAQQRNGTWTDALVLRGAEFANNAFIYDYNFVGNNNNYGTDRVQPAEFFNVDVGTGLRQFSATNNLNGHISFFQELRVNVSGLDGLPIEGAIVRVPTTDHGNRIDDPRPLFQNSRTFSNNEFNLSEATTGASGQVFFPELLTGRMWVRNSNTEQLDLYSQSGVAGVDDFTAQFISFNELPSSENLILHSSSEILVNKVLLPDGSLTELNESIVRGYTSISIASEFYDYAKVYLVDNFKGEQSTIVSRSGETINAGSYNVTFNPSAAEVFSFDEATSTITVKSTSYSGGITTVGEITVADGVSITGSTFSSLNLTSGKNLSGVTVTGELAFNDDASGSYDLEGSTIGSLVNEGSGLLEFANLGSVVSDSTDAEISVNTVLTIVDLSGGDFKIIAWDDSNPAIGSEIYSYATASSHSVNVTGINTLRVIADKPEFYSKVFTIDLTEGAESFTVSLDRSLGVDATLDLTDLINDSLVTISSDPHGLGFDVLTSTVANDHILLSANEWRRYHDYFAEQEPALLLLGSYGLSSQQVFNTSDSGLTVLRPTIEVVASGTNSVSTAAFVDTSLAEQIFPPFVYTPRNSSNVAVITATANPIVDYTLFLDTMRPALENINKNVQDGSIIIPATRELDNEN